MDCRCAKWATLELRTGDAFCLLIFSLLCLTGLLLAQPDAPALPEGTIIRRIPLENLRIEPLALALLGEQQTRRWLPGVKETYTPLPEDMRTAQYAGLVGVKSLLVKVQTPTRARSEQALKLFEAGIKLIDVKEGAGVLDVLLLTLPAEQAAEWLKTLAPGAAERGMRRAVCNAWDYRAKRPADNKGTIVADERYFFTLTANPALEMPLPDSKATLRLRVMPGVGQERMLRLDGLTRTIADTAPSDPAIFPLVPGHSVFAAYLAGMRKVNGVDQPLVMTLPDNLLQLPAQTTLLIITYTRIEAGTEAIEQLPPLF